MKSYLSKEKKNSVPIDIVSKVAKKLPISKLFRQSEPLSAPAFDVLLHLYQLIKNEKRFWALLLSANCYCGRRKCLYLSSLCVTSFVSLPEADGKREPVMLYKHYKPHNVETETNIKCVEDQCSTTTT